MGSGAMGSLADTPEPPCWAVVFSSVRHTDSGDDGQDDGHDDGHDDGYDAVAARMLALARAQPGCLGVESVRGPDGTGVTVSYWDSQQSIRAWKNHPEHLQAQARAGQWYADYRLRICKVARD